MRKRNIYMVQVDVTYGYNVKSAYIPYAVGILAAYAFSDDNIKQNYELKRLVFLREEVDSAVASLEDPYLVGFSNYIWSTEYNKMFAKRLKEVYPNCIVLFGGHNVPPNNSFLEEFDYIDFLIHSEGEEAFKALLLALLEKNPDFSTLPNLSYRNENNGCVKTPVIHPTGLDYPSPYLEGIFEPLFENNKDIKFSSILETSRGCPYCCAFCDWALLRSKIRLFPLERVYAEIRWMAEHKVEYCWGTDSNFGIFERDEQIVDYLIEMKKKTGYPEKIRVNYAKNNEDTVFRIVKKLHQNEISKFGATLSFQSLSPEVLRIIGRKNMDFDHFKSLMLRYNDEKIRTYTELILGLPGETYESFCKGIGILLASGQHNGIEVYRCVVLPNSIMGQTEFKQEYGIKTVKARNYQVHTGINDIEDNEVSDIIVSTNAMSIEEWIRANQFYVMVQSIHGYGLLRCFAIYLYNEKGVKYEDFYNALLDYAIQHKSTLLHEVNEVIRENNAQAAYEEILDPLIFEKVSPLKWLSDEYSFLRYLYEFDRFYDEIGVFLKKYAIEQELYEDLLNYQKSIMKLPGVFEKRIECKYDYNDYFQNIYIDKYKPLKQQKNIINIKEEIYTKNWDEYTKHIVWYGRMGGKSMFDAESVEYC